MLGDQQCIRKTGGDLSLTQRWQMIRQNIIPFIQQTLKNYYYSYSKFNVKSINLTLNSVRLPDNSSVYHALEQMQSSASVALQNHCLRTWCYAAAV